MYEAHWNFANKPFAHSSDPRYYYPSESHQGALLKLRYAVESKRGAALLSGAPGLGKTLLINGLLRQLPESFTPKVHLVFPQMPPDQLLAYLAGELTQAGPSSDTVLTIETSIRKIQNTLSRNTASGQHCVIAIDEAHLLTDSTTFETLRLILNLEHDGQPTVTMILAGQPTLLPSINRLEGFEERLGVKCLLRPFSPDETASYISHRLNAGGATQTVFTNEAIETIHHLAAGVPRKINRLCDLALLIAFADEQTTIGADRIEDVSDELIKVAPE